MNGRTVYVAYDSDLAFKPQAEAAIKGLWTLLRSRQAIPARVLWPQEYQQKKWGVDDFLADSHSLEDLLTFVPPMGPLPTAPRAQSAADWRRGLLVTQQGVPRENVSNLLGILERHPAWQGQFWWDTVRSRPMHCQGPLEEGTLTEIARWLGMELEMSVRSLRLLETCVRAVCQQAPRDLLKDWLHALPPWDGTPRLREWLAYVAKVTKDEYGMEVSRLIPVAMVAWALDPGCQFRDVVILEGAENTGKSKLVQTLATPEWYVDFDVSMESKESYMLIQGAWVAELAELATLSRTEEAKLKSFLTLQEDVWVPKYSNFPMRAPRRTIFIGTVNPEDEYLKGQTGNTRFLPIKTGAIDCAMLADIREQLFAEALDYYSNHPHDWWQLSAGGQEAAAPQREARRQSSVYETDLPAWLETRRFTEQHTIWDAAEGRQLPVDFTEGVTSWPEIAQYYLKIDREKWKDKALQIQIAQALRAAGWEKTQDRKRGDKARYWRQQGGTT